MERITRTDLKNMHTDFVASQKKRLVENIIEQVKRAAQQGRVSYTHTHSSVFEYLFPSPLELVERLQAILVDVDVVYAEPYVAIRWN